MAGGRRAERGDTGGHPWGKQQKRGERGIAAQTARTMEAYSDRDLRLLMDLYRFTALTIEQIREKYFPETQYYVHRKLALLRKRGVVESGPYLVDNGHRLGKCVFITKKGVRVLVDYGWLDEKDINFAPRPRLLDKQQLLRIVKLNELDVRLKWTGWKWFSSRETKQRYNLNRGARLGGMLRYGHDRYGVYYFDDVIERNKINHLKTEIQTHVLVGIDRVLIITDNKDAGEMLYRHFHEDPCQTRALHILPYKRVFDILRLMDDPMGIANIAKKALQVDRLNETNEVPFARYTCIWRGYSWYVAEYLTVDAVVKHYAKQYTLEEAQRQGGKGVILLVPPLLADEMRKDFAQYPHFHIVSTDIPSN